MSQIYNAYCDESCHLENDHQQVMVLGAVWCPLNKVKEISKRLREIKVRHGLKTDFEIKWTKVSPAKQQFYLDILDYFFDDDDLHLRVLLIPDKSKLNHANFQQTHDDWYYKMYFTMLKAILNPDDSYRIYLDIKDTRSAEKIRRLHKFLCEHMHDHDHRVIERLHTVRSHESSIMQVADLLIGAVGYANRQLNSSDAKNSFLNRFRERSRYVLTRSTLPLEQKSNIFIWRAKEEE
jgi:hypothetical protein